MTVIDRPVTHSLRSPAPAGNCAMANRGGRNRSRATLTTELAALPGVEVFPSAANFLLGPVPGAEKACTKLLAERVLGKNLSKMHELLANGIRHTASTPEENSVFVYAPGLPDWPSSQAALN